MKQFGVWVLQLVCLLATLHWATAATTADASSTDAMQDTLEVSNYYRLSIGTITGTITDVDGNPLAGISVAADDFDNIVNCQGAGFWSVSQGDGSYSIEVPAGTYMVFVNSHNYPGSYVPEAYQNINSWTQIATATQITVTAGQIVNGVDFHLPVGYTITGRLVDDQGQPVLGAGGNIKDPDQDIEFGCALGFGTSETDGTFRVNVPNGTYDLSFNGVTVRYSMVVTDHISLGDVLFAQSSEPPREFDPQVLESGYAIETVVPGSPNTPSDVAVLADGTFYLAAVRSWNIYEVGIGGTITSVAPIGVYSLDAGSDANLYGYFMPSDPAPIYRITPQGDVTTIGNLPMTSCESTLTVAPNLDVWIGYNLCGGTGFGDGRLYRLNQAGQLFTIKTGLPFGINGLDFDSSGQLYMTIGSDLFRVNTSNGNRTLLAHLPGGSASHGLVIDPAGNFYVSSQGNDGSDRIFKITQGGTVSTLVALPAGCLQGLARTPTGDLIATMRCTGTLYRVHPDGTWELLLPGNGLATPQALAFSPTGELFVNNDESGRIVRIVQGQGEFFTEVISYIPPLGYLAFDPQGNFYFSEGAPGFQPRLIRVSSAGEVFEVTRDVSFPSGLTFTPNGTLYVAENLSGEISSVTPSGVVTTFVNGILRPQSMAADSMDNLYVAGYGGTLNDPGDPNDNPPSNRIWKIDPAGVKTLLASLEAKDLAFDAAGDLLVSGPTGRTTGVLRITPDGTITTFATGFLNAVGLAFDVAGNLYISDDEHNSITRITGFPQGFLQGTVTDAEDDQPLAGATLLVVTDYPLVLGTELTANDVGHYATTAAPGSYKVTASLPGYRSSSQMVVVQTGVTVTVDLELMRWTSTGVYLPIILKETS